MFGFVDDVQDERFSSDSELTTAPAPSSRAWTLEEMPAKAKATMLMTTFIMDVFMRGMRAQLPDLWCDSM